MALLTDDIASLRFTVVVPAHGVAGRLSEALESVLGQALDDGVTVEVIPVCGAPDSLEAAVAARYAARDTRVRTHRSPPADGLSGARNTGAAAATGDYLLFLDGDDTLAPGALTAIADRLAETGEVDVLYLGHERVHWWNGTLPAPDQPADTPAHTPDGAFAPDAVPSLTGLERPAWSAVHRRLFVAKHDLLFPAGSYTDIGWSGRELLAARRVAVLDRVCVRHLLRRQGDRLRLPGEHQFDLLDQAELVLASARERGLAPERLNALFEQLTARLLRTAAAPDLLPYRRHRLFFQRASALYRRHRPAGFRPPEGRLGVQHRLLASGSYTAFTALRAARRRAGRAKDRTVRTAGRIRAQARRYGLDVYGTALRRPLDENLAVYCAYWGRGYACNPAAVHAAAKRLAPHIRSVFLVTEDAARTMPEGVEYAVIGSPRYWEVLARAKYLINNANFADTVVKRPGSVHLQTQHGTPLKTMGVEQAEYPVVAAHSGSFGRLLSRVDRWDYNLSSNPHSTEVWQREFPADHETLEYGYPRNDVYCTASAADVARIRGVLGVPQDRTAILYAPTHRDYRTGYDEQLDLEEFCEAAGEEFVILMRAHYFYAEDDRGTRQGGRMRRGRTHGGAFDDGRIIDVTRHPSAEEICLAADALITDYSSIMFDYAVLDRPMVVYADDWDVYRETRGVTFDLMTSPPGPVARTAAELARIFRDGEWADGGSDALRERFRERFCAFDDGLAAERVVRRVLLGEPAEAIPPVIPLAARTPAPAARPAGARSRPAGANAASVTAATGERS